MKTLIISFTVGVAIGLLIGAPISVAAVSYWNQQYKVLTDFDDGRGTTIEQVNMGNITCYILPGGTASGLSCIKR